MTQRDQVIHTMEQLGGIATLGELNRKVAVKDWKTRTPYATIRRIVQDERYFFKIKPGLWGLKTHREKLDSVIGTNQSAKKQEERDHYYYQGLLLEMGNIEIEGIKYQTFVPNQDKNKPFLRTTLGEVRTLQDIYQFSHKNIVNRARTIDVIWFNKRKMPYAAFEIEHSTDFTNALSKYLELQDFNIKFHVVASPDKEREFKEKISRNQYGPIRERVKFMDYEKLAQQHSNCMEIGRSGGRP